MNDDINGLILKKNQKTGIIKNKWKKFQNDKTFPESKKWWIKKKDKSTFFPDSWSEEKIKKEIAEAYGNMKTITITENWASKTYYWWKMSDGVTNIEFQIDVDWSIKSAYPNLQEKFIKLFK